jgi:hypothetical protein
LLAEVVELDWDVPEVELLLPLPPLPALLAELLLEVFPPVAVAPLVFDALPLSIAV